VWVEVEGCFDVKARSEEEIRDLIEEGWGPRFGILLFLLGLIFE